MLVIAGREAREKTNTFHKERKNFCRDDINSVFWLSGSALNYETVLEILCHLKLWITWKIFEFTTWRIRCKSRETFHWLFPCFWILGQMIRNFDADFGFRTNEIGILTLRDIPWINRTTVKGGPDNCKSVSDLNQIYMVDTPMDPIHKNRKVRSRPQKWAELGGGQSWAFSRFGTPQGVQIKLFCYKRFSKNLKRINMAMGCIF